MVYIATTYGLDSPGFEFLQEQEVFPSVKPLVPAMRPTQPPVEYRGSFSGVK
jgi:hypothetical protein